MGSVGEQQVDRDRLGCRLLTAGDGAPKHTQDTMLGALISARRCSKCSMYTNSFNLLFCLFLSFRCNSSINRSWRLMLSPVSHRADEGRRDHSPGELGKLGSALISLSVPLHGSLAPGFMVLTAKLSADRLVRIVQTRSRGFECQAEEDHLFGRQ